MSEWQKVGSTQQRLYPDGTLGCIHNIRRGDRWTHFAISRDGFMDDTPCGVSGYDSIEDAKAALDKRFDPQPEEHRFDTITVYKLGGKETHCWLCLDGFWSVFNASIPSNRDRELIERQAREWLKQQVATT